MSNLPYGLAPTHLSGQQVYGLWNADSPDRYKNLSRLSKAKWNDLALWINERATAQIDVTDKVAEKMYYIPQPRLDEFDRSETPERMKDGVNIHDDDLAAAAMRFYKEYGPKPEPVVKEFPKPKESQGVTEEPKISMVEIIDAVVGVLKLVLK